MILPCYCIGSSGGEWIMVKLSIVVLVISVLAIAGYKSIGGYIDAAQCRAEQGSMLGSGDSKHCLVVIGK